MVDQFLRVFGADPQLEGLELHPDAALKQHFVSVAGTVANAEKERPGLEGFTARADAEERPAIDDEIVHARSKAKLDAQVLHPLAHGHQNGP